MLGQEGLHVLAGEVHFAAWVLANTEPLGLPHMWHVSPYLTCRCGECRTQAQGRGGHGVWTGRPRQRRSGHRQRSRWSRSCSGRPFRCR